MAQILFLAPELKCLVVDDEVGSCNKLKDLINQTEGLVFWRAEQDPIKALEIFSDENNIPDIVFLDNEMPGMTGREFAKAIMGKAMIVFTTAYSEFAAEAYRLKAVDYLIKPIIYEHFLEAVNRCRLQKKTGVFVSKEEHKGVYYKDYNSGLIAQINIDEIDYITCVSNYSRVYYRDGTSIMRNISLKKFLAGLSPDDFFRVQKSFIVNLNAIKSYDTEKSLLTMNTINIEVGRTYKKRLKDKLLKGR